MGADPHDMKDIVDSFHRLYYDEGTRGRTWQATHWLGVPTLKFPADLWIYQEIVWETRPDLIVETGTFRGGSALFLASVCEVLCTGRVLSIDVEARDDRPRHPRIEYLTGSSTDESIVETVRQLASAARGVMVILDSDHSRDHVLGELEAYGPLVTIGSYMIVEDTNVNGHPVLESFGPGPMEAVKEFLGRHPEFVVDQTREKFLVTFNPGGYLRRQGIGDDRLAITQRAGPRA